MALTALDLGDEAFRAQYVSPIPPPLIAGAAPGVWLLADSNWEVGSHPFGAGWNYEDQKAEAARNAKHFCEKQIPKFFGWKLGLPCTGALRSGS